MSTKSKSKRLKSKISKPVDKSDSDSDDGEHELSHYINDRVKLMKEVLKIIKPKKIKTMAPDCIKDLDIEEINSMLLEELLGISNKRLKYIFSAQNPVEDSSSTDPEEEKQPIDIISLDDVSDDDLVIVDSDDGKKTDSSRSRSRKIKKEKHEKRKKTEPLKQDNLMSVLELLELQARARAIRSQLMLEANKKAQETGVESKDTFGDTYDGDDDDVIIEVPKNEEIIIMSSDSEERSPVQDSEAGVAKKKITLFRNRVNMPEAVAETTVDAPENAKQAPSQESAKNETVVDAPRAECNEDEIILIVDQDEMDGMMAE